MYIHICIHVMTTNEKGHYFETVKIKVYRRAWKEEMEKGSAIIILSEIN